MKRCWTLLLFIAALLAARSGTLRAQGSTPLAGDTTVGDEFYRHQYWAVGLNVGLLSGTGVAGRISFPGGFTIQSAFFVITPPFGNYSVHYNFGAEAQYAFIRNQGGRLYSLLGMGYYDTRSKDTTIEGNVIANPFRMGLGLGYEWFTSRQFVISLSGAITYFPNTGEVYPLPQIGFFFYFR